MKLNRMKIFAAALALSVCATIAAAQTEPAGPPPGHHFMMHGDWIEGHSLKFFTNLLSLTDAQQTQIKQLITNAKPALTPLMQQEMQSHEAMRQLVTSGAYDQAKAQAIASQEAQTHEQLELQHAQIAAQAYQLLTADQKTKLNDFFTQQQQKMAEHMQRHAAESEEAPNQ